METRLLFIYCLYYSFFRILVLFSILRPLLKFAYLDQVWRKGLSPFVSVFIAFPDLKENHSYTTLEPEAKLMPF